jgi:hypothetical protein
MLKPAMPEPLPLRILEDERLASRSFAPPLPNRIVDATASRGTFVGATPTPARQCLGPPTAIATRGFLLLLSLGPSIALTAFCEVVG